MCSKAAGGQEDHPASPHKVKHPGPNCDSARDTAGKPLWFGGGEEEESLVGQETRRAAVSLSLLLCVIFGALTSLTDAVTCG